MAAAMIGGFDDMAEVDANARLIAAAPDLLGALEALLIFHQSAKSHPLHVEARKAVSKARCGE